MPWREVCPMEARIRFVMAVLAQEDSMSALCEEYGVSRRIGYKWIWRYQREGVAGLVERRRGPRRVPWSISQAQVEAIIGLRRAHPKLGAQKAAWPPGQPGAAGAMAGPEHDWRPAGAPRPKCTASTTAQTRCQAGAAAAGAGAQ